MRVRQKNPRRGFSRWGRLCSARVLTRCSPWIGHRFSGFWRLKEEGFSGVFLIVRLTVRAGFRRLLGGVGFAVDGFQLLDAHVGVDGRGFELFVTQELLDEADVRAAFEHVGGA